MSIYRNLLAECDSSETITAAGAATVAGKAIHFFQAASALYAVTLADGTPGQLKWFKMTTNGATHVVTLTPASARNFTSYTFNAVGEWALMQYRDNAWEVLDSSGATKVA